MRLLLLANLALAVLLAGHVADHVVRQPASGQLPFPENLPGVIGAVMVGGSLVLALLRHRLAIPVAAAVGALTAAGFAAIHLLPRWSMFSDPYPSRALDGASWAQMLATMAAGALLAAVALRARRTAAQQRSPDARTTPGLSGA